MKTSSNETRLIEAHLLGKTPAEERLLFEARLILQPDLKQNMYWQQKTYHLVQLYGRQQLKKEIEQVHQALFSPATPHQSFRQKILKLFGR
ncbi:MAG TPA: hypothetical protein VK541_25025 [Pedobacter sp.]|uniref:hypothetical protein n=1 Tax=Pedobacter sp. TaxID=1411316 RepID=UPI002BFF375C|nr:hypothetical protein [Pedobacter sp.]HMI05775.1 hypothetical protein [Pedobacter sp.]